MKKQLLGTTALAVAVAFAAAPANAADKISLGLGGFMEDAIGVMHNEENNAAKYNKFGVETDTEVYFRGLVTTDNGIKFSARIEIEADGDSQNVQIDESFLQVSTPSLGLIEVGSADHVTDAISKHAPKVGWGVTDADDWISRNNITQSIGGILGDADFTNSDAKKINYYTPSDWLKSTGFQAAAGFQPKATHSNNAVFDTNSADAGSWAAGLVFNRKINDINVYADYGYISLTDAAADHGHADGHQFGLELGMGPWTVAGSWVHNSDGLPATTSSASYTGNSYTAGVAYKMDKWTFGLSWAMSDLEGAANVAKNDKYQAWDLGAKYNLGKGIDWRTSLLANKQDEENNVDSTENSGGYALVTGFVLGF